MLSIFKYKLSKLFALSMVGFFGFSALSVAPVLADTGIPAAPNSALTSATSSNWSGYVATGGIYTQVSGSWIVPSVTGSGNSLSGDATWIGIGGVNTADLIQTGTQAIVNNTGGVTYQAWYEKLPSTSTPVSMTVNAGDTMAASITQISQDQWGISLKDITNGQSFQVTTEYRSSLSSADWVEEMLTAGNGLVPLDNFGSANFSAGFTVKNGLSVNIGNSGAVPMTMINPAGASLSSPSSLGIDGASFSLSRTTAQAAVPNVNLSRGGRAPLNRTGVGVGGYSQVSRTNRRQYLRLFILNSGAYFKLSRIR